LEEIRKNFIKKYEKLSSLLLFWEKMGRKIKYITELDRIKARRARQKKYYWKHREKILDNKKIKYWSKKVIGK
jgi:hypothetical protein